MSYMHWTQALAWAVILTTPLALAIMLPREIKREAVADFLEFVAWFSRRMLVLVVAFVIFVAAFGGFAS